MGVHKINNNMVDINKEIEINGIKYVRKDEKQNNFDLRIVEKIVQETVNEMLPIVIKSLKEATSEHPLFELGAPQPKGLDKLTDEKKGSELVSMLFERLPKGMRQGPRLRSFYTDFERDTGIELYKFHKARIKSAGEVDISKYPYRKADSIFMISNEKTVMDYVSKYRFKIKLK